MATDLAGDVAIDARSVSKTFRHGIIRRRRVDALREVDLHVDSGEIFGLLGPNGAGKTTLLKILLGIVRPDRGTAQLLGMRGASQKARRSIGYLPENFSVPRHHTGRSALRLLGRLSRMSGVEITQKMPAVLELVGLRGREDEPVRNYSKGMRQRLGLAQCLLHSPQLIFLDEPTDGLDPVGRHDIRRCIERLRDEGKTVFINSHILQEVSLICDRFAIMNHGRVVASGSEEDLIRHAGLDAAIHLAVIGGSTAIDQAIEGFHTASGALAQSERPQARLRPSDPRPSDRDGVVTTIEVHAAQQKDIDRLIDLLRLSSISIASVQPIRADLEEAFIHLVGRRPDEPIETLAERTT